MHRFLFPKWANQAPRFVGLGLGVVVVAAVVLLWYYGTNKHLEVGYAPVQPVEFSHKLHAGDVGMDCRYCHSTVERSSFAAVPPTQTCMNCHTKVRADSTRLIAIRESYEFDKPMRWVRVHELPQFVYFDHSAHLAAGVGCSTCHGRIDQMPRVTQSQPLSMSWCLDCHRNPAPALRPASEITNMAWQPAPGAEQREPIAANGRKVHPPTHCSGCHR
jgi:hypothetical protein